MLVRKPDAVEFLQPPGLACGEIAHAQGLSSFAMLT